jgi:hypothetical protein
MFKATLAITTILAVAAWLPARAQDEAPACLFPPPIAWTPGEATCWIYAPEPEDESNTGKE